MKPLALLLLTAPIWAYGQQDLPDNSYTVKSNDYFSFRNCVVTARLMLPDMTITKWYQCGNDVLRIIGKWHDTLDRTGVPMHYEFGNYWNGELADFGSPIKANHTFKECRVLPGGSSNSQGYMSVEMLYACDEATVELFGQWGEEYQGHWSYSLEFGEVHMQPQYVKDVQKLIDFSDFQKWCPTKYGYKLCGWIDVPEPKHGTAPAYKR